MKIVPTDKALAHFRAKCQWYKYMQASIDYYLYGLMQDGMYAQFLAMAERDKFIDATPLDGKDWLSYNDLYSIGEAE